MGIHAELSADAQVLTIRVTGRFDYASHTSFRTAYESLAVRPKRYVIDLALAQYLDSSALGMLLLLREHAGGDKAKIKVLNCQADVKNILLIANFDKLFQIE